MGFLEVAEIVGIAAFAYSALLVAKEERLDLLGSFIVAFLTALGGGVVRDVIVDRLPVSFSTYFPAILVLIVVVFSLSISAALKSEHQNKKLFVYSDAVGLVSFAINGALVSIDSGLNLVGVSFLALITAVGGGVMRDLLINRIPFILKEEVYGSIALGCGVIVWGLHKIGWLNSFLLILLFIGAVWLRIVAYRRRWHLPRF